VFRCYRESREKYQRLLIVACTVVDAEIAQLGRTTVPARVVHRFA